jgi:hypothetical protein
MAALLAKNCVNVWHLLVLLVLPRGLLWLHRLNTA